MTKKPNRRVQTAKPNRHSAEARVRRVQDLRRSNAAQPHKIRREDDSFRKYGMRAILKSEG